jgi:serine protease Do
VVGFENQVLEGPSQLRWLASTAGVGRPVTLRVQRGKKLFDVHVTLGKLPEQRQQPAEPQ